MNNPEIPNKLRAEVLVSGTEAFDENAPDDVDIADAWRDLQLVETDPKEVTGELTRLSREFIVTDNVYELERLAHFFPETRTIFKTDEVREQAVQLLKRRIVEGDPESAVKIMDLLDLNEPVPLSDGGIRVLVGNLLEKCATAEGDVENLYRLGVSRETIQREAMIRIGKLLDIGNDYVAAATAPYFVTNIVSEIPEIEKDASCFVGKTLENFARENIRHGVFGPIVHFVDFFENGDYPIQPSPYSYIRPEDIEEGIRYLLGHHDVKGFKAFGWEMEMDAKWDLFQVGKIIKHVPLSDEFRSSPEILSSIKKVLIAGLTNRGVSSQYVREMFLYFNFSTQDIAEISQVVGDMRENVEPYTIDAETGNVEPNELVFEEAVKSLLPRARDIIQVRRDISWIIKSDICAYYYAPRLTEELCEQFRDLFPKTSELTAAEVKALAIAWHELSNPKQIGKSASLPRLENQISENQAEKH